jgi:hypothetical protein
MAESLVTAVTVALQAVRASGRTPKAIRMTQEQHCKFRDEMIAGCETLTTWTPQVPEDYIDDDRRGTFMGVPWYINDVGLVVEAETSPAANVMACVAAALWAKRAKGEWRRFDLERLARLVAEADAEAARC